MLPAPILPVLPLCLAVPYFSGLRYYFWIDWTGFCLVFCTVFACVAVAVVALVQEVVWGVGCGEMWLGRVGCGAVVARRESYT